MGVRQPYPVKVGRVGRLSFNNVTKPAPNHRYILIRLIDKLRRNQPYYRALAASQENKSKRQDIPEQHAFTAAIRAECLQRNVEDLQYVLDRATEHLTTEDLAEILSFDKQDYHDRSNSLPKSA